jgi:hypothetical protein
MRHSSVFALGISNLNTVHIYQIREKKLCKILFIFFLPEGYEYLSDNMLAIFIRFLSIYGHFYVFPFFLFFYHLFSHFLSVSLAYVLPNMPSLLPLYYYLLFITISLFVLYSLFFLLSYPFLLLLLSSF